MMQTPNAKQTSGEVDYKAKIDAAIDTFTTKVWHTRPRSAPPTKSLWFSVVSGQQAERRHGAQVQGSTATPR